MNCLISDLYSIVYASSFCFSQERFLLDNNVTRITSDKWEPLWWIPITYTTEKQLNFNNTQPTKWMKAERSITLNDLDVNPSQWILFNVQETGNYFSVVKIKKFLIMCNLLFIFDFFQKIITNNLN